MALNAIPPSSSPPLAIPLADVVARNEAISTISNSSARRGKESSPKTYLFSIQVFVDGELVFDDGDMLELAQFNYALQEEKLAQKLAN